MSVGRRPEADAGRRRPQSAQYTTQAQWAVSFTRPDSLVRFVERLSTVGPDGYRLPGLQRAEPAPAVGRQRVSRIHFGNEFCQRLLPSVGALETALGATAEAGLEFGFALPMLTDHGMEEADALLGLLPEGTEVTVSDWGSMRRLTQRFPRLRPVAGRLLCKMLKEPRAPSAAYMKLGGHGFMTPGFEMLLGRFSVSRLEIDLPPFARGEDLCRPLGRVSVHAPFGFATTGRICRIGNLHRPAARKFATGHPCARECLTYWCELSAWREPDQAGMRIFQRGNTIFYRHTAAMTATLDAAIAAGSVDRIIISGDWNEADCADKLR